MENEKNDFEPEEIEAVKAVPLQPEWVNSPTVVKLQRDVNDAEPDFQDHVSDVKKWISLRDGNLKIKIPEGQSRISPKVIRKQNEWRYASLSEPLLSSEDMFDVEPATHEDVESAKANELVLNKQFNKDINRVEFIDELVRTAVDEGTAFVRVGWDFQEEEVTFMEDVVEQFPITNDPYQLAQMKAAVQAGQMAPQQMFRSVVTGQREATRMETVVNKPTVELCDYTKIMLDPTCGGKMDDANFIVYQFYSSKSELHKDPKYSNIDSIISVSDENAMSPSDDDIQNGAFNFEDEPRKKLLVTEYWGEWDIDNDGTTVPIVATYVGSTMIRLEENPFPDGKPPFVKVNYLPKRRDIYGGEPDAVLIEDNQDVIGAISRGMIDLMGKSANAQQGISADALDPAQKLRFEQGKDYIFNPGVDPSKAFFMGTYPEIPRSALEMIQYHENAAESLTGVKSFTGGISGQALGSTATGIRSALDATAKRELGILRRISFGIVEIGRKISTMNAVNLSDEEVIRITDKEEVTISREDLAGEFDLKLSISTPEVDQEQAQDLAFMLQTIGPNMDPGLQGLILSKIARLKKMPGLAEKIETFKPEPDPMQEKIKQLEVQLLEAQVANERAQGTENQADTANKFAQADLNAAKTETEYAKTRSLESGSDMTDLQFLQEKGGTKHRQQMQLNEQQFDQELGKKAADSMLDSETPNNADIGSDLAPGGDDLRGMDTPQENLQDYVGR